jgi:hypothetical protein
MAGHVRFGRFAGVATLGALASLALWVPGASAAPSEIATELRAADAPRAELTKLDTVDLPRGAQLYRFEQEVGGLPVFDSLAVVADPAEGAPESLVTDETDAGVDDPPAPEIGSDEAIEIARQATDPSDLRGEITAELGIEPGDDGGTQAWQVLIPSGRPLADFDVLVDAASGEVLEKGDLLQHSFAVTTGTAKLYRPNPVVENRKRYKGLRDNRDRNSDKLTNLRRSVQLPNLFPDPHSNNVTCLEGVNVYATVGIEEVCGSVFNPDFSGVKRKSQSFEALMAYYHIDRTLTYLNGSTVGASVEPGTFVDYGSGNTTYQQDVRANTSNEDNSFYSATGRQIELGQGKIDDGEDGDVINHEYGHSVQDSQIPGTGLDPNNYELRAIGEAFGDYLAAIMSQRYEEDEGLTTISNKDNVCIFDWDGLGYAGGCGRSASVDRTYSDQNFRCSSFHCLGQVWSSALWALRSPDEPGLSQPNPEALGTTMDVLVLGSNYLLTQSSDIEDAAYAVMQADDTIYPFGASGDFHGQNYQALIDEFVCREFIAGSCF